MSSSPSETAPSPNSDSPPPPPPPTSESPAPTSSPTPPESSPPSPPPAEKSASPPPPPSSYDDASPPPPPPAKSDNASPPPPPSATVSPPPPRSSLAPPPPPPASNSTSDNGTSSSSDSSSTSSSSSLSTSTKQLIVGASVGLGLFFLVMVVVCVIWAKRNKKRKHDHEHNMQYYGDPSHGRNDHGNNMYYNNTPQQPNWHMPRQGGGGPPPPQPAGSPHGAWPSPPAPPPLPPGLLLPASGEAAASASTNFSSAPGPPPPLPPPSPALSLGFNKSTFGYDELAAATGGFSQGNLVGQGGFGYVHKGVLPNGKEVAVKSLKSGSGQGEREFQAEVEIISRVHHRHLVSLVGYCIAGGQRMLVYDFVPNKTLEYHLHGKDLPTMDWPTRLRIATGSAKGLAYLHEDCHPRIIHRDIKAANILIDYNFEAMVADFGLAKLSSDNYTHVSTRVMGTFGYLAPEYASSGKLTEKSDVFSFGVMLLELITGRRPVDPTSAYMEDSLVDWARPLLHRALEEGVYDELVDPRLEGNYNPHEMARMVASAAASIRHSARKRPKMSQIVRALEGDVSLDDLNEGVRPGHSSIYTSSGSSEYDVNAYNADIKKFRKVLASQEFASSEFGTSSNDSREMANLGNQKQLSS